MAGSINGSKYKGLFDVKSKNVRCSKLSGVVRLMFHIFNIDIFKIVYFAYLHSVMKYGVILGGSMCNSRVIFVLHMKIAGIRAGAKSNISCQCIFKRLNSATSVWIYVSLSELYHEQTGAF